VNKKEQSREDQANHAQAGNRGMAITIQPDSDRQPEKGHKVKNGKCHHYRLEQM